MEHRLDLVRVQDVRWDEGGAESGTSE